ncbi:hypothetical protein [Hoylesella enoeca]|uniref:hypothetical protein n=1 Tax=Hoylesella enoeca TaxID=76123 RepID=UPI00288B1B12|nr:hypothetical protein [Hoylesella enoeca]
MKKYMFLSAALLLFTASCNNDENNEQKEPAQTVQFSFTNEDFGEDEALTRATGTAEAKPQTIDLGDCEAEITVESEPAVKKTRGAQTPATGHYTIRAYQAGVLKGEMKGTFNGTNFTPDATSAQDLILTFGQTYDLIAFNDDVVASGNNLTIARDKAATALMGFTTTLINRPKKMQVSFTMKHVGARLRTQFVCQKHMPDNITATLEATATNVIPASVTYNPATKTYTGVGGAMTPKQNNSPASTETKYTASNGGQTFAYTSTADYHYFLPTTEGSKLKLTGFSAGTVFWKPLTGTIPQLNATLQMQAGKSYLVKIKLKPRFTYLFSDGTTGFRSETTFGGAPAATAKKPIAVVVGQGRAMALNLAGAGLSFSNAKKQFLTTMNNDFTTNITDMKGYEYTWETTYSTEGKVYGNNPRGYDPDGFSYAANYNLPGLGVSITPWLQQQAHKPYLPAYGEWTLPYIHLGFGEASALVGTPSTHYWSFTSPWYGNLFVSAFTQVGGSVPLNSGYWNRYYISSSETNTSWFAELKLQPTGIYWTGGGLKQYMVYGAPVFFKYQ